MDRGPGLATQHNVDGGIHGKYDREQDDEAPGTAEGSNDIGNALTAGGLLIDDLVGRAPRNRSRAS